MNTLSFSHELSTANTFEDVVRIVNEDGREQQTNELAAQYAFEAQKWSGFPQSTDAHFAHLEILKDGGAKFHFYDALKLAERYAAENAE